MQPNYDNNLIFRVIKFGLENPKFNLNALYRDAVLTPDEVTFLHKFLMHVEGQEVKPNHLMAKADYTIGSLEYSLLPNAIFQYVDYLEIKEARLTAVDAKKSAVESIKAALKSLRLSRIAIWISVGLGLLQIAIGAMQVYLQFK